MRRTRSTRAGKTLVLVAYFATRTLEETDSLPALQAHVIQHKLRALLPQLRDFFVPSEGKTE